MKHIAQVMDSVQMFSCQTQLYERWFFLQNVEWSRNGQTTLDLKGRQGSMDFLFPSKQSPTNPPIIIEK